jgi:hypothetical protein
MFHMAQPDIFYKYYTEAVFLGMTTAELFFLNFSMQ